MAVQIRLCQRKDIPKVAAIFRQAFAASVNALVPGAPPKQEVFKDLFVLLHRALPKDFFVLERDNEVQGYLVAPANSVGRLWAYALFSGTLFYWAGKWLLGMYGVPARAIPGIIRNKLLFMTTEKVHSPRGRYGRILSLAVDEEARGQGLGKLLLRHGLKHFQEQGLAYVKLEVRPDNLPAVRSYCGQGFVSVGRTRDLQGEWLVMLRDLEDC